MHVCINSSMCMSRLSVFSFLWLSCWGTSGIFTKSINFISSNKWGNASIHRIDIECSSCLAYKKHSASYLQTILCIFWLNLCLQIQLLNPQQSSKDIGLEINLEKNHSIQKWWASFRRQRLVDCLKYNWSC